MKPLTELTSLKDIPYDLKCLENPSVTRKERHSASEPIEHIPGPVLDAQCDDVCSNCTSHLATGVAPPHALSNGLWIGPVPDVLKDLYWT